MYVPKDDKIIAVIVTYNRKKLLERLLNSLNCQDKKPDEIIIVDNNSSDGSREFLCEFSSLYNGVHVILNNENMGGAGGFYVGMREARERNADLVWLMDDDGFPAVSCLSNLVGAVNCKKMIYNPLVIDEKEKKKLAFGLGDGVTETDVAINTSLGGVIHGIGNPFNGTLISKEIIDAIGFPKKEMFIWGDEVEYIYRARSKGIEISTIVTASFFHPESKSRYELFLGRYPIENKPAHLAGNHYRNSAFIKTRYLGAKNFIGHFCAHLLYFLTRKQFKELCRFVFYSIDGSLNIYALPAIKKSSLK
jgi:rhamnopyranosyl-N-acetylglucosaminyl-diphospho-decaprenol beta-1,3/1,4-galactofuranosyltransferase